MSLFTEDATRFTQVFKSLANGASVAVLGKRQAVRLALTTMFARGHLLLEDVPGAGEIILACTISAVTDGMHSRIQFIPDLPPSDITGMNMFNQETDGRIFHASSVLAEIVLTDEINRTSPKTQSILLEVIEEAQVAVDGVCHPAPQSFTAAAAQNPTEQAGTYPPSETQLDRSLVKMSIGYPSCSAMTDALDGSASPGRSRNLQPMVSGRNIVAWSALAAGNRTDHVVLDYVAVLAKATREDESPMLGVPTCDMIGMVQCTRVWAAAQGRNFVLPDSVKAFIIPLWAYRTAVDSDAAFSGATSEGIIQRAFTSVPTPTVDA